MKAIRDTIEHALKGKEVCVVLSGHALNAKACMVVGVHVDVYTGVALQLVSLQGSTVNFRRNDAQWVPAKDTVLPSDFNLYSEWYTARGAVFDVMNLNREPHCTCPPIEGATRGAHDHIVGCPVRL